MASVSREIKVFIASSGELSDERVILCSILSELDNEYERNYGVRIKALAWEGHDRSYGDRRTQEEYNEKLVKVSDIFLLLVRTNLGKWTCEEIDKSAAYGIGERACFFFPDNEVKNPSYQLSQRVVNKNLKIERYDNPYKTIDTLRVLIDSAIAAKGLERLPGGVSGLELYASVSKDLRYGREKVRNIVRITSDVFEKVGKGKVYLHPYGDREKLAESDFYYGFVDSIPDVDTSNEILEAFELATEQWRPTLFAKNITRFLETNTGRKIGIDREYLIPVLDEEFRSFKDDLNERMLQKFPGSRLYRDFDVKDENLYLAGHELEYARKVLSDSRRSVKVRNLRQYKEGSEEYRYAESSNKILILKSATVKLQVEGIFQDELKHITLQSPLHKELLASEKIQEIRKYFRVIVHGIESLLDGTPGLDLLSESLSKINDVIVFLQKDGWFDTKFDKASKILELRQRLLCAIGEEVLPEAYHNLRTMALCQLIHTGSIPSKLVHELGEASRKAKHGFEDAQFLLLSNRLDNIPESTEDLEYILDLLTEDLPDTSEARCYAVREILNNIEDIVDHYESRIFVRKWLDKAENILDKVYSGRSLFILQGRIITVKLRLLPFKPEYDETVKGLLENLVRIAKMLLPELDVMSDGDKYDVSYLFDIAGAVCVDRIDYTVENKDYFVNNAIDYIGESLKILKPLYDQNPSEAGRWYSQALHNEGFLTGKLDKVASALPAYEKAYKIRKTIFEVERDSYDLGLFTETSVNYGSALFDAGKIREAYKIADATVNYRRQYRNCGDMREEELYNIALQLHGTILRSIPKMYRQGLAELQEVYGWAQRHPESHYYDYFMEYSGSMLRANGLLKN